MEQSQLTFVNYFIHAYETHFSFFFYEMEGRCHLNIDQIMNKGPVATELHCIPTRLTEDGVLKIDLWKN